MRILHWFVVILVLGFEMPVPVYWLVLHGPVDFWRRHVRLGFLLAILTAWGGGGWLFNHFHRVLFLPSSQRPAAWALLLGLALVALDIVIFVHTERKLGRYRILGQAELAGRGDMVSGGLYEHVRHPRYLGMMAGVVGGCLLVGLPQLWVVVVVWLVATLGIIGLEERELRRRFGPAYAAYAKRVPAFLPFRF